jgi:acetyl-CoA carboxylase carboxyltransferase component
MAATLEIDAVIDPADTREWLFKGLQAQPALTSGNHLAIDSW